MATMTATDAKNRFGQMLEMAHAEPVRIQKNGRDVGIVLSPEQYGAMLDRIRAPRVRPAIEKLLAESLDRRAPLYRALAK